MVQEQQINVFQFAIIDKLFQRRVCGADDYFGNVGKASKSDKLAGDCCELRIEFQTV